MAATRHFVFPPFRLDIVNRQLWRGDTLVAVRPKPLAVLTYLVEQAGRLVSQEELRKAIWDKTYVSEGVLREHVRELRAVLADDADAPCFIETLPRRGYRFIAPLSTITPPVQSPKPVLSPSTSLRINSVEGSKAQGLQSAIVGRETELHQLQGCLARAWVGERQIIFVTGEAGIGKTTVVEAFLERIGTQGEIWIGRGQCVEQHGAGEAYLPILDALSRLHRGAAGQEIIRLLRQSAPTWLVQMPTLLSEAERETLQQQVAGATKERMLRELAEAIEVMTSVGASPESSLLVLVLEDLHWSDVSTLDFLAYVARRREAARLFVLATYRPVEVVVKDHPLRGIKQELQLHRQCAELALEFLRPDDIVEYLAMRFGVEAHGLASTRELARLLHRRTDGNPLFMVNVVENLIRQGMLGQEEGQWQAQRAVEAVKVGVPDNLQQMIEQQVERLSPEEQQVLEVASVVGTEFSAAAVAAGLETGTGTVEEHCTRLVRRGQFLRVSGLQEWPDGTVAAGYSFGHALYREVLYERVSAGQRMELHRRLGERIEAAYGQRVHEVAAELATHFERGRKYQKAVQYLQQAGENALQRSAPQEAIDHLTKGLEFLRLLPDSPERSSQELTLQIAIGAPLMTTKSPAAREVAQAYTRARELCQQVGEIPQRCRVLIGLWMFYLMRAEYQTAYELGDQLLSVAQRQPESDFLLQAHQVLGLTLLWRGEFPSARTHCEHGIALYNPQQHHSHAFFYGVDPGVGCLTYAAYALWTLGYPDQGLKSIQEGLALASIRTHPYSYAYVLLGAATVYNLRRDGPAVQEQTKVLVPLATEQGFPVFSAVGTMLDGWALTMQGQRKGILQMSEGLTAYRATGAELGRTCHQSLLAEAHGKLGQTEEGLLAVAVALAAVAKTEERWYEAELYRLKGELTLLQENQKSKGKRQKAKITTPQTEAEAYFHQAIAIARHQEAKSWELRAAMSLSRLWQQQGKQKQAHQMLAEIYGWFTEGFDTKDLQEAKALLEELSH